LTPLSRSWLLSVALTSAAALAQPALAETANADAPTAAHHGQAFAVRQGAQARIIEPDGRVLATDGWSDLVAPASIAQRETRTAIARLIRGEAKAKPAPAGDAVLPRLQEP
jgi:hypothetical protein